MKKHLNNILTATDDLLLEDLRSIPTVLVGVAQIRSETLLAIREMDAKPDLPEVRPLKAGTTKKKAIQAQRVDDTRTTEEVLEETWAKACPMCGAAPYEPCVAVATNRQKQRGAVLNYIHSQRTGGKRSLKNIPPPRPEPVDAPVVEEITPRQPFVWANTATGT